VFDNEHYSHLCKTSTVERQLKDWRDRLQHDVICVGYCINRIELYWIINKYFNMGW
jgi:hypothetical protein